MGTAICLVIAGVITAICLPLVNTVVQQITLMVPRSPSPSEREAVRAVQAAWRADRPLSNTIAELHILATRSPSPDEIATWETADPDSALPIWASLLMGLREAGIPASSQPASRPASADNEPIAALMQRAAAARPLRIGGRRLHEVWLATLADRGIPARRAEAMFTFERYEPSLSAYRPVVRELCGRLANLAASEQAIGRAGNARLAWQLVLKATTEIVSDSPSPDVALLAARQAEPAARALESALKRPPGGSAGLRDFYDAWMQVSDREIALLPATLGPAPARAAQDRVLAGMTTAAALVLCGWMLALVCLAQIFVIAVTRPFGPPPWRWRWSGWAPAAAGAMIALPVLVLVPAVAWGTMPFIWLFSGRSIGAMVLLSTSVPLAWMTATRIFVVPPEAMRAGMLSRRAVLAGLALLLLVGFLVAVLVPMDGAVWRPPAGVQVLRRIGGSVGLAAIAILVVWTILGVRSRRRAGVRAGMWARAGLAVASAGLVPLLAAAAVALAANAYRDARHAEAFSRAVADPVSDRLGPDWYGRYFEPARRLAG